VPTVLSGLSFLNTLLGPIILRRRLDDAMQQLVPSVGADQEESDDEDFHCAEHCCGLGVFVELNCGVVWNRSVRMWTLGSRLN
jgi:hypothetical protein